IVTAVPRGDTPLDFLRAFGKTGPFFLEPGALARLRAQRAFAFTRLARLVTERIACGLGLRNGRRSVRQLLEALPEVRTIVDDRLELPIEQAEHHRMLGAERPAAGRTFAFGAEPLDLVALVLHLLVLLHQLGAPGAGILFLP